MIDPFVLLAPMFLLGAMALLGFIGCVTKPPLRLIDADDPNKAQLGFVTVSMVGGTEGTYQYGSLSPNVTLNPGQRYHIVCEELNPGDQFYDQDTMVRYDVPQTVTPAIVETGVYSDNPGLYVPVGGPEHSYGPVNFEYVIDS